VTDLLGHFSFALLPEQLGTVTTPVRYFVKVTAPGYSTRMLEITLRPTHDGLFRSPFTPSMVNRLRVLEVLIWCAKTC
jgi:hypothetical protein